VDDVAVSVVGLGNMGTAVAERLLEAGHAVSVYNRTPGRDAELVAKGARRLDSAAHALVDVQVCFTMLADDDAVLGAVCGDDGVLAGAPRGAILAEGSTISVAASTAVAEAAARAGVAYLRVPFSGNPGAVRAGKAAILVSGAPETAEACDPLLHAIAPTVRYVGDGEVARVLKLVLQVLIGGTAELLAEALTLGESAGLGRAALLETIAASVVGSPFVDYKAGPLVRDDYSPTFTTAMMEKDVELVLALARETGVQLPFTTELRSRLERTCDSGHAERDFMSLLPQLKSEVGAAPASQAGEGAQDPSRSYS
jgi:3-hydroxyisobutyrate dehydrogenase-like beta-hydroxyacid dehydrogenase